ALRIEGALDLPRGPGGGDATGTRVLVEAQVVLAARADDRTLEDRRPAVRTGAGRARVGRRPRDANHATLAPLLRSARLVVEEEPEPDFAPSSKPKSTLPRMRAPAATVSEPAFTSPVMLPPCCSSTRLAL